MLCRPYQVVVAGLFLWSGAAADEAPMPTLTIVTDPTRFATWIPNKISGASKIEVSEDGKHLTVEAPAGERLDLLLRCPPQQTEIRALQEQWVTSRPGEADPKLNVLAYQRPLPLPGFDRGLWEFGINVPPLPGAEYYGAFACIATSGTKEPIKLSVRLLITEGSTAACTSKGFTVAPVPAPSSDVLVQVHAGPQWFLDSDLFELGIVTALQGSWFPGDQTAFSIGGAWVLASARRERMDHTQTDFTFTNALLATAAYLHRLSPYWQIGMEAGVGVKGGSHTEIQVEDKTISQRNGLGSAVMVAPVFTIGDKNWHIPIRLMYLGLGEQPDSLILSLGFAYLP